MYIHIHHNVIYVYIYIHIYQNNLSFLLSVITLYFYITNLGMPCIVVTKKIQNISSCRSFEVNV
jgi:hypothetical protein